MGRRKAISVSALHVVLLAAGMSLSACSFDRIEPAPVYMRGAGTSTEIYGPAGTDSRPPIAATQKHYALTQPAPQNGPTTQSRPVSKVPITANDHPNSMRRDRLAMRAPTATRKSKPAKARIPTGMGAVPTATIGHGPRETIPLDDLPTVTPERAARPLAGAASSQLPNTSWVSP